MESHSESDGERAVKAALKHLDIEYEQEKRIHGLTGDTHPWRDADFYLPEYDIYIEFFGGWEARDPEKKATERRRYRHKRIVYEKNNIRCIYLYPNQLHYCSHVIEKTLAELHRSTPEETTPESESEDTFNQNEEHEQVIVKTPAKQNDPTPKGFSAWFQENFLLILAVGFFAVVILPGSMGKWGYAFFAAGLAFYAIKTAINKTKESPKKKQSRNIAVVKKTKYTFPIENELGYFSAVAIITFLILLVVVLVVRAI